MAQTSYIGLEDFLTVVPDLVLPDAGSEEQNLQVASSLAFISAASGFVDQYCRRPQNYFAAADPDNPTERIYRGKDSNSLQIGRHLPGSVTVLGIAAQAYYEGANGWLYALDPGPSNAGIDWVGNSNCFWNSCYQYRVTAAWGFDATPEEIKHAVKAIAEQIFDRGQGILGQTTPAGFIIERDIPLTAKAFLQPWIRRQFEVN